MNPPVRAYLVDDSAVSRHAMRHILSSDPGIEIAGEAASGEEALEKIQSIAPDIVLMDIVMPGVDGLEATRELMRFYPKPVLIISDQIGGRADLSFEALRAGALDVVGKPSTEQLNDQQWVEVLRRKVRMLAEIPVITRYRSNRREERRPVNTNLRPTRGRVELVCVGASTGGPPAIRTILSGLRRAPFWSMIVVQHMSTGFIQGMASWLRETTVCPVQMATNGSHPKPGVVYFAPDGRHLEIADDRMVLTQSPPLGGHRPSVDRLFSSVASSRYATSSVAFLLTGMGQDGARGLEELHRAGTFTAAQNEASSVVFGMPKAAIELEAVNEVMSIDDIATYLVSIS